MNKSDNIVAGATVAYNTHSHLSLPGRTGRSPFVTVDVRRPVRPTLSLVRLQEHASAICWRVPVLLDLYTCKIPGSVV
ncbi:MAG: hypothetical protein KatS3mg087_1831 [Patescibacteria group bacterium]|nr:MAG: hypothetical protein KatS3mg087_1831 [Patescibacteria group bacterium]